LIQKLLMSLLSLFMMVASSISPAITVDGGGSVEPKVPAGVAGAAVERFATLDAGGAAFATMSVLWVEIDGRRVFEDAWGSGTLETLTFKVGVKPEDATTLQLGERRFALHPTDVITVRGFNGRFAMSDLDKATSTLALDGTVQATFVAEKASRLLRTEGGLARPIAPENPTVKTQERLAYVVLGGTREIDVVTLQTGMGQRLETNAKKRDPANPIAGFPAAWVRVNGELLKDYAWSDGLVDAIEFQIPATGDQGVVVNASGQALAAAPGERVVVRGFAGTYVAYQVPGGWRVKLDGYAERVTTAPRGTQSDPIGLPGTLPPVASFGWTPLYPTTSSEVTFIDYSYDPDGGQIVSWAWNFGDGSTSNLPCHVQGVSAGTCPRHRFAAPGAYNVTLEVRDNTLMTNFVKQTIVVGNTPPVADFEFTPKNATDLDLVQFIDRAYDLDGHVVEWRWDFGDGSSSQLPNPKHKFADNGTWTVTLVVVDDKGNVSAPSRKVVGVANVPPTASFVLSPGDPTSLETVLFTDTSQDRDGTIARRAWTINGEAVSQNASFSHVFRASGEARITLTVADNDGAESTATRVVQVRNRDPVVNFRCTTGPVTTSTRFECTDDSTDADGTIAKRTWDFCDGASFVRGPSDVTISHTILQRGACFVRLTVEDGRGGVASGRLDFTVANSPPVVDFTSIPASGAAPSLSLVTFTDRSYDPDEGDVITSRLWRFGDGKTDTRTVARNVYERPGTYNVTLTVHEAATGESASLTKPFVVLNQRPRILLLAATPVEPEVNQTVRFNATVQDRDGSVVSFTWNMGDGTNLTGLNVLHRFRTPGQYTVTGTAVDDAGGVTTAVLNVRVLHAKPKAAFTFAPAIPRPGETVVFTDASTPVGAPLSSWEWRFGDGLVLRGPSVSRSFGAAGTYSVQLRIQDGLGQTNATDRTLRVNAPPTASFTQDRSIIFSGESVTFTPTAADSDGGIARLEWRFGDGQTAVVTGAPTPIAHVFAVPGSYKVTLTAVDIDGANVTTLPSNLVVRNRAPTVSLVASPGLVVLEGQAVTFLGSANDPDGTIASARYTFGDGRSATGSLDAIHQFNTSGIYTTRLTVTDNGGLTATAQVSITVMSANPVTVRGRIVYPDGEGADLSRGFAISGRLSNLPLGTGAVVAHPNGTFETTLAAGAWRAGQRVDFSIVESATLIAVNPSTVLASKATLVDLGRFVLLERLSFKSAGILDEANRGWPVLSDPVWLGATDNQPAGATYVSDPGAPILLAINATWSNGRAARGVTLEYTWSWLASRQVLGDAEIAEATGSQFIPTHEGSVEMPKLPGQVTSLVPMHAPGWYRWTASLTFTNAELGVTIRSLNGVSGYVYVDPGGATTAVAGFKGLP